MRKNSRQGLDCPNACAAENIRTSSAVRLSYQVLCARRPVHQEAAGWEPHPGSDSGSSSGVSAVASSVVWGWILLCQNFNS